MNVELCERLKMSKQIEFDRISDYANLKLFDLEILNEMKKHIREICSLRDSGVAVGIDVDTIIKKIKSDYKNLLKQV